MFEELYAELPETRTVHGRDDRLSRINFEASRRSLIFEVQDALRCRWRDRLLCIEVAKANPDLRCISFDLPPVEPIARKHIAAAG